MLVHCAGAATNSKVIIDPDFGVIVKNSYRLIRTVEMYQTQQTMKEIKNRNGRHETVYSYSQVWSSVPIPSSTFSEASKRNDNPSKLWPF